MDLTSLLHLRDAAWLFAGVPAIAIAGLLYTVRLRGVQWRRLGAGLRTLRGVGETSSAQPAPPALAQAIAVAGTLGAAAAVGSATAVSLGGPAVLPYVWLFCILLAPLRFAEVLLARTDAPGRTDAQASGSLARRLLRLGGRHRTPGALIAVLVALAGFGWAGAAHADGLAEVSAHLLPGGAVTLGLAAAGVGGLLAAGGRRAAVFAGWLGLLGILALLAGTGWAIVANADAAFGALGKAFSLGGVPRIEDWSGAAAGEIAAAAVVHALSPAAATTGVVGSAHSLSSGPTKGQAAAAMLGPLIYAIVATLLVAAFGGVFGTRVEAERAMPEVRLMTMAATTRSEREEEDRYFRRGLLALIDGEARSPDVSFATARGMIEEPIWTFEGEPADVRVRTDARGRVEALQIPREVRVDPRSGLAAERPLEEIDIRRLWNLRARGQMLPDGGTLVVSAGARAGNIVSRLLLAALLALMTASLALWGLAIRRSIPRSISPVLRGGLALLPAAGAAAATLGVSWLTPIGGLCAAALAVASALALLIRSEEVAKLGS